MLPSSPPAGVTTPCELATLHSGVARNNHTRVAIRQGDQVLFNDLSTLPRRKGIAVRIAVLEEHAQLTTM